jgi:integrase
MAHVQDRWFRTVKVDGRKVRVKLERHGVGKRYRVKWTDPDGVERSESFDRRGDADRRKATIEADKARGTYLDPRAGQMTLAAFAADWLAVQTFDGSTRGYVDGWLRNHINPALGSRPLAAIGPGHVQHFVSDMSATLAPSSVEKVFGYLSTILSAAVDEGRIVKNPCRSRSVRLPRAEPRKVVPWPRERVAAVCEALPERYQVVAILAAGCGLRQGEVLGLDVGAVDFLNRVVNVRTQLKAIRSQPVFALPKGKKTREVPLPESVAAAVARHVERFPPTPVTLPWAAPDGNSTAMNLLVTTPRGRAVKARTFHSGPWRQAVMASGVAVPGREDGMHALRHWFASVLLDGGVSIKALSEYLGHTDPGFTLRTYTHLMPSSDQRMRAAIDDAMRPEQAPDGPTTARGEAA